MKVAISYLIGTILGGFLFVFFLKTNIISREKVKGAKADFAEQEEILTPARTLTPTLSPTSTPTPLPTNTPTPLFSPTPTLSPTSSPTPTLIMAPSHLENLFNQYATEYKVDGQLLKRIAWCESRFDPVAVNGQYLGLYQFKDSIWITWRTQMGHDTNPDLRSDANEAIKTAAYLVSLGKLHLWPNCVD